MKKTFLPILICLTATMSSCHDSTDNLASVGSGRAYAYEGMYTETQFLPHKEDIPSVQTINSNTLPSSKSGDEVYRFVLSNDIKQFYQASIALRLKILNDFYTHISGAGFNTAEFSNRYRPLLAPNVRAEVRKYAKANHNGDALYSWQPFTPLPIASKIYTRYEITYDGDDWFSIKPTGDDTSVRLKVVLAGREMLPVIAEIENPAFGINTGIGTSNNLGSGYTFNQDWEFGIFNNCKGNRNYWNYIAGIIYRHCAAMKSGKNFISEAELLTFAKGMEQKREQFLQDFYADLTSTACSAQAFSQKYNRNITQRAAYSCIGQKPLSLDARQYTKLRAAFEPKDKRAYTIVHKGQDWYSISSADNLDQGIELQVIFYEAEMHPLIVGIRNYTLGIDCQQDFGKRRDAYITATGDYGRLDRFVR